MIRAQPEDSSSRELVEPSHCAARSSNWVGEFTHMVGFGSPRSPQRATGNEMSLEEKAIISRAILHAARHAEDE